MSYFALALKLILEERKMTQRAFAELAGIDPGLFSRYLSGGPRPGLEMLEKIVCAFPADRHRADIAVAHLKDETPPSAADLVKVVNLIASPQSAVQEQATPPRLPRKVLLDFNFLMEYAERHPEIGEWLRSTVDVLKGR